MVALLVLAWSGTSLAQQPEVHLLHQGVMTPPGAIGRGQLQRGGPLPGFFQPVEIKAPSGASVSLAVAGRFGEPMATPVALGLLIGPVYRLRVTGIPLAPGVEVYPTIEMIDRLYTPEGQQRRFAIPVELTEEDLRLAAEGKFVTRVIYLEDPLSAMPAAQDAQRPNWFDVAPGRDPLVVADELGRPMAILRMGARLPGRGEPMDETFLFGCPPFQQYGLSPSASDLAPTTEQQQP